METTVVVFVVNKTTFIDLPLTKELTIRPAGTDLHFMMVDMVLGHEGRMILIQEIFPAHTHIRPIT